MSSIFFKISRKQNNDDIVITKAYCPVFPSAIIICPIELDIVHNIISKISIDIIINVFEIFSSEIICAVKDKVIDKNNITTIAIFVNF